MGWSSRQAQRCGLLGKAGSVWGESLDSTGWKGACSAGAARPQPPHRTGPAQVEDARPAHAAGATQLGVRSTEAVAILPATAATATAAPAAVTAYVNPFLAASQNWHPCDSDESSAEESGLSTSSLPEPSRQLSSAQIISSNPFAAAAEQWLAARQNSLAESGDANLGQEKPPASQTAVATAARHSSRNVSDHSSHGRQNLVGSPRAQHKRERSGGKHMAVSQADQEMRSPFEALQFQHRSSDARAGPPPAKIVFRNSLAESSSSGDSAASCTIQVALIITPLMNLSPSSLALSPDFACTHSKCADCLPLRRRVNNQP